MKKSRKKFKFYEKKALELCLKSLKYLKKPFLLPKNTGEINKTLKNQKKNDKKFKFCGWNYTKYPNCAADH